MSDVFNVKKKEDFVLDMAYDIDVVLGMSEVEDVGNKKTVNFSFFPMSKNAVYELKGSYTLGNFGTIERVTINFIYLPYNKRGKGYFKNILEELHRKYPKVYVQSSESMEQLNTILDNYGYERDDYYLYKIDKTPVSKSSVSKYVASEIKKSNELRECYINSCKELNKELKDRGFFDK